MLTFGTGISASCSSLRGFALGMTAEKRLAPRRDTRGVDGDWIYVEDRTEGRTLEQLGPPMASSFSMRVEEGAVILNGHGSGHKDVRVALDGSVTERPDEDKTCPLYTSDAADCLTRL